MPSASSFLTNNMSGQLVAPQDTYQTNAPMRLQQHQQAITSSQTSLQKLSTSSPQFPYILPQQQQTQQQQMQLSALPSQQPQPQAQTLIQQNALLIHHPPSGNQMSVGNMQQHVPNGNSGSTLQPSANYSVHQPNSMMIGPMVVPNNMQSKNTQLHQHPMGQYPNNLLQSQQHSHVSQQLQHLVQTNQQQQQPPQIQAPPQQQVPITTLMIPASAASHIHNASWQIQQAAMQNNPNFQQMPHILVFMVPYLYNNNLPPTIPPTPDQGPNSLNSTLIRQSHSNSSTMRQNRSYQTTQQQLAPPQSSSSSSLAQPSNSLTQSRAMSSLSSQTSTTTPVTSKQQEPEKFYIKVNFSFHARSRQELSFQRGEILHVLDTLQHNDYGAQYWLATRVNADGEDTEKGLIPNKIKAEEIALEQRTMDIGENTGSNTLDGSAGGVLSASVGRVNFLRRRTAQRSKSLCKDSWDNVVFDIGSSRLPTYERVVFKHPGFCRPVVIFGPLSDLAREKLLKDYPEKYSYPTSLSQAPDHPKVIRLKGVLDVIDQGKHALLDITAQAVEKLNHVNLAPIVIFMKTDSKSIIKEFRSRAAKSLDPNVRDEDTLRRDGRSSRKLLEQSAKLEKQWFHVFTAILDLSTMGSEMWYRKLRETIENQQSSNVWMSEKKSDKKLAAASASGQQQASNSSCTGANVGAMGGEQQQQQALYATSSRNNPNQQQHQSTSCLADSSSIINEKFSEALNISGTKSTNDLMPPNVPEGIYGNRSQLRNAYAHSLAQKLARASSEPRLNGLSSDHEEDEDQENDENDDNDDDDDDDEIIKKPFSNEQENSSSISSSNEIASALGFINGGQAGNSGTNSQSQIASTSNYNANVYQQHFQYQPVQQHQQVPIKPPAPPPTQQQQQHQQFNEPSEPHLITGRQMSQPQQQLLQQQESIYSVRNQLMSNSFSNNGLGHHQQNGTPIVQHSSSGSLIKHRDYHPLIPVANNSIQNQDSNYHQLQFHPQASNGILGINNNGASATSDNSTNGPTNNVFDLTGSHDTRNSAFRVYSDINRQNNNNYHYYDFNKIQ